MAGERRNGTPFSAPDYTEQRLRVGKLINNRYVVENEIGEGGYGMVYKVIDTNQNSYVAMKGFKFPTTRRLKRFDEEVSLLNKIRKLHRENKSCILFHLDDFKADGNAFLVFELLEKTLKQYIQDTQGTSLEVVQKVGLQILRALQFLVSAKVIHADLKPDNIMFSNVSTLEIKIIDLGCHLIVKEKTKPKTFGAVKYRSPEAILLLPYNFGTDIWCVGCVLFELRTGRRLFDGSTLEEQLWKMTKTLGKIPDELLSKGEMTKEYYSVNEKTKSYYLKKPNGRRRFHFNLLEDCLTVGPGDKGVAKKNCRDKLKAFLELLTKMIKYNPSERISAAEAKDSTFFEGMNAPNLEGEEERVVKKFKAG